MGEKNSFVLYNDLYAELELLTINQRGEWITAVFNYARNGEMPAFDDLGLKMMFSQTRRCLDRDAEKYEKICKQNFENGKNGGRPPKKRTDNEKSERFSNKPKKADNDNVSDNVSDNDNVLDNDIVSDNTPIGEIANKTKAEKQKKARFIPPTVNDIKSFCAESGITIDAEYFIDYYNANGWRVGNHKMENWRATVRNWYRRDNKNNKNETAHNGSDLDDLF